MAMAVSTSWKKIPRDAPEGTPWSTGKCHSAVNDWLAKRATDLERERVANLFNHRLNLPITLPSKVTTPVMVRKEFRPDLNMSFGSGQNSAASVPSTPADCIHVAGDSMQQPSMPPGMAPEGWGVTEGGEKGEVNIKPHRKKKTAAKKPKHIIPNKPKFAPTRALTSYETHYSGSEVMPDMYEKVASVTRAYPSKNLTFVSEWADDLKNTDMTVWKKNLVSNYQIGNLEVNQSDSNQGLREHKADLFYRWARQKGLYYGKLMTPDASKNVDNWMRTASNKEREEALAVFRSMHCVVDPHASGAVALEDGSHEHETFQHHRPSTADKDRHTEYRANKDADGKALSSDQALEMGRRMERERKRLEKENRQRRAAEQQVAEKKAMEIMEWKKELLKEFTPDAFKEKETQQYISSENTELVVGPRATTTPVIKTPPESKFSKSMEGSQKVVGGAKPINDANASTVNLAWGGNDPNAGKSSYFISHGENIPDVMAAHKNKKESKVEPLSAWNSTTPAFGAVNYLGYENTRQPKQYIIPRHMTDGLKQESFAAAFIPTPNMKRLRPPPHRPLRPTSSSIAGSAARRDPNFVAAAMAARRATMSARPGHLKSNVPLGNQGLRTRANWATTYSEAHTGRQEMRPSTVPTGVGRRGASRGSEKGMGGL